MKTKLLFLLVILFDSFAIVARGQTPIFEYRFNESGASAASTGSNKTPVSLIDTSGSLADLHSAGGLGVSGLPSDKAFDNTASTAMGSQGVGGVALVPLVSVPPLSSFTFQCWFKVATPIDYLARLIDCQVISLQADAGAMVLHVNSKVTTSAVGYSGTGEWEFLAFTYDGTKSTSNVVFYAGSTTTPVYQVGGIASVNGGEVITGSFACGFGNDRDYTNTRPVAGSMDDVRLYGSSTDSSGVLTLDQLESIRRTDIANDADALQRIRAVISGTIIEQTGTNGRTISKPITIGNVLKVLGVSGAPPVDQLEYCYDATTRSYVIARKSDVPTGFGTPVATVFSFGNRGVFLLPSARTVVSANDASGLDGNLSGMEEVNAVFSNSVEIARVRFWMFGRILGLQTIMNGTVSETVPQ